MRETWQSLFIQILPYSFSSEIRMLLSSSCREGTSHRRVLGLQGKVRKSFLDTSLLRFFLLERFSKYHILGVPYFGSSLSWIPFFTRLLVYSNLIQRKLLNAALPGNTVLVILLMRILSWCPGIDAFWSYLRPKALSMFCFSYIHFLKKSSCHCTILF